MRRPGRSERQTHCNACRLGSSDGLDCGNSNKVQTPWNLMGRIEIWVLLACGVFLVCLPLVFAQFTKSSHSCELAEDGIAAPMTPLRGSGNDGKQRRIGIEKTSNDLWLSSRGPAHGLTNIEIAVHIPDGFTNRLELFTCTNLMGFWWTLAATNLFVEGMDIVCWTENPPKEVKCRCYAVGNADVDSDDDDLSDAREKFLYHTSPTNLDTDEDGVGDGMEACNGTNPIDPNDPPNLSGTIFYSGVQTGMIRVIAATNALDWISEEFVSLSAPGAYRISNLLATNYWIKAYCDLNGNGLLDGMEASAVYSNNPVTLTGRLEKIDIHLVDSNPDTDGDGFTDYEEIVVFHSNPHVAGDLPTQYSTPSDDVYFGHPSLSNTNFVYSYDALYDDVSMGKGWIHGGLFTPDLHQPSATIYYGMPDHLDFTNFFMHSFTPSWNYVGMGKGWPMHKGFITDFRDPSAPIYYGQPNSITHRSLFVYSRDPSGHYVGMGKGWATNNGFVADYQEPSALVYFSQPDHFAYPDFYVYSATPGWNAQNITYGWIKPGGFVPDLNRPSGVVYFGSPDYHGPAKNFTYSQLASMWHSIFVGYGWATPDGMLAQLAPGNVGSIYYGCVQGYSNLYVFGRSSSGLASASYEGFGWVNLKDYITTDDPDMDWDDDQKMDYYDPYDSSGYQPPNDSQTAEMKMEVGDVSGSHTELYLLKVGSFTLRMPYVNSNEYLFSQTVQAKRSNVYVQCYIETLGDSDEDGDYYVWVSGSGLVIVDTNHVLGSYEDTGFNSGRKYFDVYVPRVDLIGHKPGTMTAPGMAISRVHEDRPSNLIVPVNDDNDDGGAAGHHDDDDTLINTADNDIIKILLKKFQPASLRKGTVELSVSPSNVVRVYKSASQLLNNYSVNLASRRGDLMNLPIMDIPLYIEALEPCGEVIFHLAYKNEGGEELCQDEVRLCVLKVELFTNPQLTIPLDDWSEVLNISLRSPKYIFGKDDNIYILVRGPSGLGNFLSINVKSESDPTGFDLPLKEMAPGVYKNNQLGDLLRLDSSTRTDVDAKYIKVVDEEMLTFELKYSGNPLGYQTTVMVDRGEFATATARSFDSLLWFLSPPLPSDRTPIWNIAANEFAADVVDPSEADLNWWMAGCIQGSYAEVLGNVALKSFIQNAGQNLTDHGESDLFYSQSHGSEDGNLSGTTPLAVNPSYEEQDIFFNASADLVGVWGNDVDWAVIKACSILCTRMWDGQSGKVLLETGKGLMAY